jgi:hypothetical protein
MFLESGPAQVEAGMDVMRRVEELGSPAGAPSKSVTILECGELPGGEAGVEGVADYNRRLRMAQADQQAEREVDQQAAAA